jgi:hypothetical protein
VVDNAELEWAWGQFDFIHARNLGQSIKDWEGLANQMFEYATSACIAVPLLTQ